MKTKLIRNPHPGEILAKDFLVPLGLTNYQVAKATGIPQSRLSRLVKGRVGVTADTAYRLGVFFGVSPQTWLNLQNTYDLMEFERHAANRIRSKIQPLSTVAA